MDKTKGEFCFESSEDEKSNINKVDNNKELSSQTCVTVNEDEGTVSFDTKKKAGKKRSHRRFVESDDEESSNNSENSSNSDSSSNNYYSNSGFPSKKRQKRNKNQKNKDYSNSNDNDNTSISKTKVNNGEDLPDSSILKQIMETEEPILLIPETNTLLVKQLMSDVIACEETIATHKEKKNNNILQLNIICPFSELLCRHRLPEAVYLKLCSFFKKYSKFIETKNNNAISMKELEAAYETAWKKADIQYPTVGKTLKHQFFKKLSLLCKSS